MKITFKTGEAYESAAPLSVYDAAREVGIISREVIAACSGSVIIPMSARAESFNAAVAASILMWEFAKGK